MKGIKTFAEQEAEKDVKFIERQPPIINKRFRNLEVLYKGRWLGVNLPYERVFKNRADVESAINNELLKEMPYFKSQIKYYYH